MKTEAVKIGSLNQGEKGRTIACHSVLVVKKNTIIRLNDKCTVMDILYNGHPRRLTPFDMDSIFVFKE